jgi:large subunit ribosomal protein L30
MAGKLRVTLVKSTVSHTQRTRATVKALGLRRIGHSVEVADTPQLRGMANAVRFLVRTEEIDSSEEAKS